MHKGQGAKGNKGLNIWFPQACNPAKRQKNKGLVSDWSIAADKLTDTLKAEDDCKSRQHLEIPSIMDVTHCKNLFGKANEELFLHVVENFRSFYYDVKINKSILVFIKNWIIG